MCMITGMAESKQQRRAYRQVLAQNPSDRLSDLVAASHAGSDVCLVCSLVRPVSAISDGVCDVCQLSLSRGFLHRLVEKKLASAPLDRSDPLAVYVDASWQAGVAGVAIVGALGRHSDRVQAQSSGQAEVYAMMWALRLAKQRQDQRALVFRTDNQSAQRAGARAVPRRFAWTVEWVPRRRNHVADRLAFQARLAA
jgi:hypothetical protein